MRKISLMLLAAFGALPVSMFAADSVPGTVDVFLDLFQNSVEDKVAILAGVVVGILGALEFKKSGYNYMILGGAVVAATLVAGSPTIVAGIQDWAADTSSVTWDGSTAVPDSTP